jgi:acyl dehydratase
MSDGVRHWSEEVVVGREVAVRRTVSESDVYMFAGITGDLNRVHMNAEFMATTRFKQRLVHGAYILGLISAASTALIEVGGGFAVAYGHDRVRYLAPTFIGDTLKVVYRADQIDASSGKVTSTVEVTNQHDQLVVVASHIIVFVDDGSATSTEGNSA